MRWKRLDQQGDIPGSRSSHCLASLGPSMYMFGGEQLPRIPVEADTYCYDLPSGSWTRVAVKGSPPGPRVAATMTTVGDRIYLFGGRTGVDMGEGARGDLFVLDPTSTPPEWAPLEVNASSPTPPSRSYHAATTARGKLYIFGGCGTNGRLNDLWEFDPSSKTWLELPRCDAVGARGGGVMVAAPGGAKLIIMGGFNGSEMSDCHMFDLTTSTWSCPSCCSMAAEVVAAKENLTMPLARSVFGAAVHGHDHDSYGTACGHAGHIVTFGGEVEPSDKGHAGAGSFTAATYCLCPSGGTHHGQHDNEGDIHVCAASGGAVWHTIQAVGDLPGPRGWFAASVVEDSDLVVHGGLGADNERLGDMYKLCLHG